MRTSGRPPKARMGCATEVSRAMCLRSNFSVQYTIMPPPAPAFCLPGGMRPGRMCAGVIPGAMCPDPRPGGTRLAERTGWFNRKHLYELCALPIRARKKFALCSSLIVRPTPCAQKGNASKSLYKNRTSPQSDLLDFASSLSGQRLPTKLASSLGDHRCFP